MCNRETCVCQTSVVAESDATKPDLGVPSPDYAAGFYLSASCRPGAGEQTLLRSLSQRPKTSVHDAALAISATQAAAADSMEDFVRVSVLSCMGRYSLSSAASSLR